MLAIRRYGRISLYSAYDMASLGGRMIWEFEYRRCKMEKIYRRIRTVYTIANTAIPYKLAYTPPLCYKSP